MASESHDLSSSSLSPQTTSSRMAVPLPTCPYVSQRLAWHRTDSDQRKLSAFLSQMSDKIPPRHLLSSLKSPSLLFCLLSFLSFFFFPPSTIFSFPSLHQCNQGESDHVQVRSDCWSWEIGEVCSFYPSYAILSLFSHSKHYRNYRPVLFGLRGVFLPLGLSPKFSLMRRFQLNILISAFS